MAKKDNEQQELEQQQEQQGQPEAYATGRQLLKAKTREDLFRQVEAQKASLPEGKKLLAGAVGKNADGEYVIIIDIN